MLTMVDVIGTLGVLMLLTTYFLVQIGALQSKNPKFSLFNLLGASLLLYSLIYNWNLASVIIEICWMSISIYGLIKHYYLGERAHS